MQSKRKQDMNAGNQEFVYEDKGHAAKMLQSHYNLRNAGLLCDVTLRVAERNFPCHKTVLISSSSYFKAMFTGHLLESTQKSVVLKDVDPATVEELLEFMYTSKLVVTASNVQSLLATADLFQILPAKTACCQYMEQELSIDNCYEIYRLAGTFVCPDLFAKARDFIAENFSTLKKHEDFVELTSKELIELISSDLLNVENEEEVFNTIDKWNSINPGERDANFHKILEHVRLPMLSPYFLCQQVGQFPAVKNCGKCLSLLNEAKEFHFLRDIRMEIRLEWTCFRTSHAFREVIVSLIPCGQNISQLNLDLFLVKDHHANPEVTFCTKLKPLLKSYHMQGIAALESTLYLIGGESTIGSSISEVFKYNLEYDMWTELSSMKVPRCQPAIALLYDNIYVLGGRNGADWINSVEYYNPHMNTWENGIDLPVALQHITAVAFKGCIYATGIPVAVEESKKECKNVAVMFCYNSATKSWTELPPMPCPCYGTTAFVSNSQICLIGGKNIALVSTRTVQSYDPEKKIWSIMQCTRMPHYRPGAVIVNGATFLGYDCSYLKKQGLFEYKHFKNDIWKIVIQKSTKDYVQWTRCAVLKIRKDILIKHTDTYQMENAKRNTT